MAHPAGKHYNPPVVAAGFVMRFVVPVVLLLVALIHALPAIGITGAARLAALYGFPVNDPNLEILLRHRAVLFGLVAALLACAAFKPELRALALAAGLVSVLSFLVLAAWVGGYNVAIATVVRADIVALVLLLVGAAVQAFHRPEA